MIKQLNALEIKECKKSLLEELKKYESILYSTPDLILNQVIRGDLALFNVGDEMLALCHRFVSGNDYVFFVTFAYSINNPGFFTFRHLVKKYFKEISEYIRHDLGCDRLEFRCVGNAHTGMYRKILSESCSQIRQDYYFNLNL